MKYITHIFTLTLLLGTPVLAQEKPHINTMGFTIGVGLPLSKGNFDDLAGNGMMVGGKFMSYGTSRYGFGAQIQYMAFGDKTISEPNTQTVTYNSQAFMIQGLARYNVLKNEALMTPYIIGGAGFNNFSIKSVSDISYIDNSSGLALSLGTGIEKIIGTGSTIFIEGQWQHFNVNNDLYGSNRVQTFTVLIGFNIYGFGS